MVLQVDCPGAAICALNQTWQADPQVGMCMCNTWFGFTGGDCTRFCSQGQAILGVYITTIVLGFIAGIWGAHLLRRYIQAHQKRGLINSISPLVVLNLFLASLGAFSLSIGTIITAVLTSGFPITYVLVPAPYGGANKRIEQTSDVVSFVFIGVGYCLSVCAPLLLPLTWVGRCFRSILRNRTDPSMQIDVSSCTECMVASITDLRDGIVGSKFNQTQA